MRRGAPRGEGGVREAQGGGREVPFPYLLSPAVRRHPAREAPCLPRTVRERLPSGLGALTERTRDTPSSAVAFIVARQSAQAGGGTADSGPLTPVSRPAPH